MVGAVVDCKLVGRAVENELSFSDAIAIAADNRPKVRRVLDVTLQVVESERDIIKAARSIRNAQGNDNPAIGDGAHFHAVRVDESEHIDSFAFGGFAKNRLAHGYFLSTRVRSLRAAACQNRKRHRTSQTCLESKYVHGIVLT